MPLTQSIPELITDGAGHATSEFLTTTPEAWADYHMARRYGQAPPVPADSHDHISRRCYAHLLEEYRVLRSWFDDSGVLLLTLQSRFQAASLGGPLGDGVGWDFRPNGQPEPRMMQFKGMLIACQRSAELMGLDVCNSASIQLGGLARMVRGAFTARAELHPWRGAPPARPGEASAIDGARMAARWVARQTYTFLVRLGAPPDWAWESSRCHSVFGPSDDAPRSVEW